MRWSERRSVTPTHAPRTAGGVSTIWLRLVLGGLLLAALALRSTPAQAQSNLRLAYINSERILEGYTGRQALLDGFRRDVEGWNQEAVQRKTELDGVGRDLTQQAPMLSDEKRRELEQDYQRKLADYDAFVQKIWGADGLVTQRNEEVLRPLVQKIQQIVADLAEAEDYDLVFDAADGNIVYGNSTLDLTERVLATLNAEYSTESKQGP